MNTLQILQLSKRKLFCVLASGVLVMSCGTPQTKDTDAAMEGYTAVEDLQIVDCLLAGKVKRLGGITYVSARRGIRTTAQNCNLRGGEYVAYDRADYRSALNVWLKGAEKGDPESQTYVGEIFEKGLGRNVDYGLAATWYQKAAAQGYKRAQINLGFLYEKGLGVEKDLGKALSYYRASAGGEELVLASAAKEEVEKARSELNSQLSSAKNESSYLKQQLASIEKQKSSVVQNERDSSGTEGFAQQLAVVLKLYQKSQSELNQLNDKLASLPQTTFRNIASTDLLQPVILDSADPLEFGDIEFGRYFALIIGNQDYLYLDDLQSPHKDALRMKEVLENRYGFSTMTLFDATEKEILNAFNNLYLQVGPEDNLLVFYAGHGNLSKSLVSKRKRGYWLPTNAHKNRLDNWINNSVISDHLDRIRARSILVIADSCFAGNLASEKSAFLLGGINSELSQESIKNGISRRSRIVISSGGEKPVLDGTNGGHSIFANALINLLENNDSILRENMVFSRVAVDVYQQAKHNNIDQNPEMRPIRAAGHEGGDFYFIPTNSASAARHSKKENLLAKGY